MLPTLDALYEAFSVMDDWEDRYSYVIEIGKYLPAMPESIKTDDVLVPGCTSRVWLVAETLPNERVHFWVDSDAAIVKGLAAILMVCYQNLTRHEIQAVDMAAIFEKLGMAGHLSPNRRNGFFAMVERIKTLTAA
jgi:cysteine desulfuration protein SufE